MSKLPNLKIHRGVRGEFGRLNREHRTLWWLRCTGVMRADEPSGAVVISRPKLS
jgi:hypothetical protein